MKYKDGALYEVTNYLTWERVGQSKVETINPNDLLICLSSRKRIFFHIRENGRVLLYSNNSKRLKLISKP